MSSAGTPVETVTVTAARQNPAADSSKGIKVFEPKISVVLKKNIGRKMVAGGTPASERFKDTKREIDLTPYLGEDGVVTVSKSIREPAGMFSIVLADKFEPSQFESLYGLIEPMDVVEIRMARDVSIYSDSGFERHGGPDGNSYAMPIVMRGFVTDVAREERMSGRGPDRSVVIRGQDYGKILQIMQIKYLPNEVTGQLLLTYYGFFMNYGVDATPNKPAAQFITEVVEVIILQFLAGMREETGRKSSPVLDIQVDATVKTGVVAPIGTVQTFEGTVGDIMRAYGDVGPWNEMFIEDREAGVFLVYRPTPFKDPSGKLIQSDASEPASVSITDKDVVSISSSRTDAGVFNYYWVNPAQMNLSTPGFLAIDAAHSAEPSRFYLADYPNSSPKLYGFRRIEVNTQQGPRFDGQPEAKHDKDMNVLQGFTGQRRDVLKENNRDNVVFETGAMRLRGNEMIKAGMTVKLTRGRDTSPSEHYVVSVQHVFQPFRSFTTTVSFERGTGFIKRIQQNGGQTSPYFSEMRTGGVYES